MSKLYEDKRKPTQKETKVINIWNEEEYLQNPQYTDKTHPKYRHLEMFGENKIALAIELRDYHHELTQLIRAKHGVCEWELVLAEVAAYCEIILDGTYTPEELEKLCGILRDRLVLERLDLKFPAPVLPLLTTKKE